ncbi:hypothetical protein B0I35DRAFT_417473 [Stachybotrys elegans]|uniref:RING-type domain-containing protein n=1 Tax=Stachybotrys elegans TaxID=80388 RepID=A0A8K0T328_9HYPO|nr:hypothetical protein B0I35DRAFT_417473 [Stachybotrys elegans]
MESSKHNLDLEKELTCSICTELLFQPLTLLDCIHTFCGACLKEWFTYQAAKAERSPDPPAPDANIFTCPSCRAVVRDTKHNATVGNLLDMFVAANPDKARTDADKEEMRGKYTPGEPVLPKLQRRQRSADERRADEEDRRLMDHVRDLSLREATGASATLTPPTSRRRRGSQSGDDRPRSSRDRSDSSRSGRRRDGGRTSTGDDDARQSSDQLQPASRQRERRSTSRQRQVEHQASLRSLISSADMSDRDIQKEIEEFARQIQEEGLLDGLDLDNIDLSRDDELSRRITEAYRRRQRERARNEGSRRNNGSSHNSTSRTATPPSEPRPRVPDTSSRTGSRPRPQARSASGSQQDERSRPPTSMSGSLEAPPPRSRRRTTSHGRSETLPALSTTPSETRRGASRSQTDLTLRPQTSDATSRPNLPEVRSVSTSAVQGHGQDGSPGSLYPPPLFSSPVVNSGNSFSNRAQQAPASQTKPASTANSADVSPVTPPAVPARSAARYGPVDLAAVYSAVSSPLSYTPAAALIAPRGRTQLYPEPSINCSSCGKTHIEYEIHYNCSVCSSGQWTICKDCYRARKGCKYWFGFGNAGWAKWEKSRPRSDGTRPPPHLLTASRYLAPASTPGGADGRRTLTTDDPQLRRETGTFCEKCEAWTNECYWRCNFCNEGDWGFCNNCVNQGKSCSHLLLPLAHEEHVNRANYGRPSGRPASASILTGPEASSIGPFKALTFSTRCDICQDPIAPTQIRHHCYSCTSSLVHNGTPGDYDICMTCYRNLVAKGDISDENGPNGWRRCLHGHRMAMVGFTNGKVGQWRYVERDLVGGRALRSEPFSSPEASGMGLMKYSWRKEGDLKVERLVTKDVAASAPPKVGSTAFEQTFPPDGGTGQRGVAKWSWYPAPGADNELLFPKGAEIGEIKDVNGDWFFGTYMGAKGLFPGPYVRLNPSP